MPIETVCQGCGKRLRVADEHAGKLAKCPQCQAVYTVPQSAVAVAWGAGTASDSPLSAADRWHLKTPDGLNFGPVARAELDRWLTEGRIIPQSQILHEGDGQWVWAGQIYPHLQNLAIDSPFMAGKAGAGGVTTYIPPATTPYGSPYPQGRYQEPHHGGLILALALVGVFACDILSIAALVMAIIDLQKMSRGTMDSSGRGLTIAGLIIPIAKLVLLVGFFAAMAFFN